jgi:voltage-dependent calcium channel L type alpha-1D
MNLEPRIVIDKHSSSCRALIYDIVTCPKFDLFILVCIILNTVVLGINWYSQPPELDDILDYVNYFFAFIFTVEALLKIISYGMKVYFRDTGNSFDFVIVLSTIISTVISLSIGLDFGASVTFIRAMRISRIFKYIKKNKDIKVIFETVIITIPALTNIGGLLLLFMYIFSVLGVFLFAEIKL